MEFSLKAVERFDLGRSEGRKPQKTQLKKIVIRNNRRLVKCDVVFEINRPLSELRILSVLVRNSSRGAMVAVLYEDGSTEMI